MQSEGELWKRSPRGYGAFMEPVVRKLCRKFVAAMNEHEIQTHVEEHVLPTWISSERIVSAFENPAVPVPVLRRPGLADLQTRSAELVVEPAVEPAVDPLVERRPCASSTAGEFRLKVKNLYLTENRVDLQDAYNKSVRKSDH